MLVELTYPPLNAPEKVCPMRVALLQYYYQCTSFSMLSRIKLKILSATISLLMFGSCPQALCTNLVSAKVPRTKIIFHLVFALCYVSYSLYLANIHDVKMGSVDYFNPTMIISCVIFFARLIVKQCSGCCLIVYQKVHLTKIITKAPFGCRNRYQLGVMNNNCKVIW